MYCPASLSLPSVPKERLFSIHCGVKMPSSTNLALGTALTIRARQKLAANTSACGHPDTQSNKTNEDTIENASRDVLQIHLTNIVNPSSHEPESPTDSISLHDGEGGGPSRVPSTTSEGTGTFKFALGGDFQESFLSMTTRLCTE